MNSTVTIDEFATTASVSAGGPIMFFDGVCGLCSGFVDFAMKRDPEGRLKFAPLQGETAAAMLSSEQRNLDTVVLKTEDGVFTRSSAVIRLFWILGGFWSFAGALIWLVPKPLRNFGYRFVAASRYRVFGKKESCRLPTSEEAGRVLP